MPTLGGEGFQLFKTVVDTFGPPIQKIGEMIGQVFKQPMHDFSRYSPELADATTNIFRFDAANRSHYSAFMGTLAKMHKLGFYDDASEVWKHGYQILDTVPAEVLLKTTPDKWTAQGLYNESVAHLNALKTNSDLMARTGLVYDPRYLDPARIDPTKLAAALDNLTPLQKEALHDLTGKLHSTRMLAKTMKMKQLDMLEEGTVRVAEKYGIDYMPKTQEEKLKMLQEELGPTVTSYLPHFIYDIHQDDAMTPHLWRLVKDAGELGDVTARIATLMKAMRPEEELKEAGSSQVRWLAGQLHEQLFQGDSKLIPPSQLESMAMRLLDNRNRVDALANDGEAFNRLFGMDVYVKYYKKRMDEAVTSGVFNPFSRMESYITPVLRKTYMEPAVTEARIAAEGLKDVDPNAYARLNNWLNSLVGERASHGLEYVLSRAPVIGQAYAKLNKITPGIIYTKLLWANTSSALLNLTQPLQFGLGKYGPLATAGAVAMMLDKEKYGHITDALARSNLAESSLGAVLGGRIFNSATDSFDAHMEGIPQQMMAQVGKLVADVRNAASSEEARKLVFPTINKNPGQLPTMSIGGVGEILSAAGSFMSMAEMAVRQFTTTAGAYQSAIKQITEALGPGAKVLMKGGDMRVVGPKGEIIDVLEELSKAAPKRGSVAQNALFLEDTAQSAYVNWRRVAMDAASLNADVNFVLSGANYSPFERAVRGLPIIGPAAAAFTNYSMHVANRLATDITTIIRAGGVRMGFDATRIPVHEGDAVNAMNRLSRYMVGTFLIGGPFAFAPAIETALKMANAIDPTLPDSIDDPEVRGVIDVLEKFSLTGVPSVFGLPGVDYSGRVGPEVPWSFVTGGRFMDNPMAEWMTDIYHGIGGGKVSEDDRAKARYHVLGSFAKAFDPNQEYGSNPFGRSNPFVPMMLYNLSQMAIDVYDAAHDQPLRDELGQALELPPPMAELVARGVAGRTVYTREKMRRIADTRPATNDQINTLRQQFIDAHMRGDFEAKRRINAEMHQLNPVDGETDNLVHPDLAFDSGDVNNWRLRHFGSAEIRQLSTEAKGTARQDMRRSLAALKRKGFVRPSGDIDVTAIEDSSDPDAKAHLTILQTLLHRAS